MFDLNNPIPLSELQQQCDFSHRDELVRGAVHAALTDPVHRLRFLGRYTSWNGFFGSGVAALSGKIGRCRGLFLDPEQPVAALADRSVYVASYFFDAARDEFDDRDTVHRDTHRCLAQSTLKGLIDFGGQNGGGMEAAGVNALLAEPDWLSRLNARVASGYGESSPDDLPSIFSAIGYHLGSELLADQEFTVIDATLRAEAPDLVQYLLGHQVNIAGQEHVAYQWIAIHSGHGGGAEADHFEWATQGARLAFRFVAPELRPMLRDRLYEGFRRFADDHFEFFDRVNRDAAASGSATISSSS